MKEKDDTPEVPRAKKPRIEQAPYPEVIDLGDWLGRMEKVCQSAGELSRYLDMDKLRMLRRMETLEKNLIQTDIQSNMGVRKSSHVAGKKLKMKIQFQMVGNLLGRGIPSPHLIHGILERER